MSVINQMLKDLEQRSPAVNSNASQVSNSALSHSPVKVMLVTAVCVLALCLISFYVWQLITENNALKSEQLVNRANATEVKVTKENSVNVLNLVSNDTVPTSAEVTKSQKTILETETDTSPAVIIAQTNSAPLTAVPVDNNIDRVAPMKEPPVPATLPVKMSASTQSPIQPSIELSSPVTPKKNQMSVSRRQLSADELAEQKIAQAEKALDAKQIEKAEQLLEDVIIIRPTDSQTRKKLAALWFGRHAYQDAVNLLSQGIALNNQDSSLRMMQARIYLKQGQVTLALNTLKPLAQLKNEQYQIMLANTAQQAKQNNVAINAYKMLITMQPNIGRWHLGLAVLYDQNSQFTLASNAYKAALTNNDLSIASEDFVNDRIQAIGQ